MEQRLVETAWGPISLKAASGVLDARRPAVLVIRGAFAEPDQYYGIAERWPELDTVFSDLPGNHAPPFPGNDLALFAKGYGAACDALERPIVVCGISIGGVVGLGVRSRNLRGVLALDPPIRPSEAWPLTDLWAQRLPAFTETQRDFLWQVFGLRDGERAARDFHALAEGLAAPAVVLAGGDPLLPRRSLDDGHVPSLLDAPDFRRLRDTPGITAKRINGCGHNIGVHSAFLIVRFVRELMGGAGGA